MELRPYQLARLEELLTDITEGEQGVRDTAQSDHPHRYARATGYAQAELASARISLSTTLESIRAFNNVEQE